jgi:RpiB/LacA/LacB family sugar-phosphate isomerase
MIYISSDHGGFELKNKIVDFLLNSQVEIVDLGPKTLDINDDYPLYVGPLVKKVLEKPENKGIILCRNGVGVSMAANKYKGIRAALSWNVKHSISSRNDDDANVLAIPADYIFEDEALKMVKAWLDTPFKLEPRFIRRLKEANL